MKEKKQKVCRLRSVCFQRRFGAKQPPVVWTAYMINYLLERLFFSRLVHYFGFFNFAYNKGHTFSYDISEQQEEHFKIRLSILFVYVSLINFEPSQLVNFV